MKTKKKTNAPINEIYKECHNNFSALFKSFAPKLLDIDEETAPPSAQKAIWCVSIIAGNANVIAANGMIPSWPINQNSAKTTNAFIKNATVFGADIFIRRGKIGSFRSCSVLLSI